MNTPSERRYTWSESRLMAFREVCRVEGHRFVRHMQRNGNDELVVDAWACGRCDVQVQVSYPEIGFPDN